MHYLRVRYRHEVKCPEPDCGQIVAPEGKTSDVVYPDGGLVKIEYGERDRDMRSAFILHCPAGHQIDLYAPRDLQIVKAASAGDGDFKPIVLRTSLG